MNLFEVFLIAIGLSMDAFAVSITLSLSEQKISVKKALIPPLYFGFFQALMPLIGFISGSYFSEKIQNIDHWIAFVLLGFIGGKMIRDSLSKDSFSKDSSSKDSLPKEEKTAANPFGFIKMLLLAIATSIDALAIGITFAFLKINIFTAIIITGTITFIISFAGIKTGSFLGVKFKSRAELTGGVILIIIGVRILIEHLFFSLTPH